MGKQLAEPGRAFRATDLPPHWARLTEIAWRSARISQPLRVQSVELSEALLTEYLSAGYLGSRLLQQAIGIDEVAAVLFFNQLYRHAGLVRVRPPSPVVSEHDENWMTHADFCFVNVRATGRFPGQTGNFVGATRLLPVLRTRAIHLAPFFQSASGIVYAQNSFSHISDEVTHLSFEEYGFNRRDQLRYFIDCCHLTRKAVGFDLTPHTCSFSKVCLDRPELFRWLRFDPNYDRLWQGMTIDQQYEEDMQAEFAASISGILRAVCTEYGLDSLETEEATPARADAIQALAVAAVRSCGYYPVVPQTWNGVGLPGLKYYDKEGSYPRWDYRDEKGNDQSAHSIGMHASFKFHTGLRANRLPYEDNRPMDSVRTDSCRKTIDYLADLFPQMHQRYGFDFIRIDYVDHVFRATRFDDGVEVALSEQLSPSQLRVIAAAARAAFPPAGMLADHVGNDIHRYRGAGFTVVLGREVQHPLGKHEVTGLLDFNRRLVERHRNEPRYGTVLFPVDTHDMGHPALLGRDLAKREDRATVLLRHWFSRFASAGVGHRPKYETMGCQDLSHGIYRANNEPVSMEWGSDRAALAAYHLVEDTWASLRAEWLDGYLAASRVFDGHCWWRVDCPLVGVSYVVVTWIGATYNWSRALRTSIDTTIALADLRPVHGAEVMLGVRPAPASDEVASIRLDVRHAELMISHEDTLRVRWPEGTSWLFRFHFPRASRP